MSKLWQWISGALLGLLSIMLVVGTAHITDMGQRTHSVEAKTLAHDRDIQYITANIQTVCNTLEATATAVAGNDRRLAQIEANRWTSGDQARFSETMNRSLSEINATMREWGVELRTIREKIEEIDKRGRAEGGAP